MLWLFAGEGRLVAAMCHLNMLRSAPSSDCTVASTATATLASAGAAQPRTPQCTLPTLLRTGQRLGAHPLVVLVHPQLDGVIVRCAGQHLALGVPPHALDVLSQEQGRAG